MATHDYILANASGAAFRTDLNNALAAIVSNNSNSSSPATTYAYQWWADTSAGILKIRNSANNAWIELLQLDGTLTLEDGSASTPALSFRDDLNTGIFSSGADTFNVATGGAERMALGAATVFNEGGANVDFRIEGDNQANLFYLDAGNDRIGIGTNSPSNLLHCSTSDTTVARFESTAAGATGVELILKHTSASPADGDDVGAIYFQAESDTGSNHTYAYMLVDAVDVSNGTEDANYFIYTSTAGSATQKLRLNNEGIALSNLASGGGLAIDVTNVTGQYAQIGGNANRTGEFDLLFALVGSWNGDSVAQISFQAGDDTTNKDNGKIAFFTQATNAGSLQYRMLIDEDGLIGIGTTTPSEKLTIGDGDLKFFHSNAGSAHRTTFIEFGNSSNRITSESNFGSEASSGYSAGYKFTTKNFNGSAFETVDAMAIQAQGHILFGQTSPDTAGTGARISSVATNQAASYMYRGDAGIVMIFGGGGGSGQTLLDFRHGGTGIGSVTKNGLSNVSYNTSSDYRLKENIVDLTGAITRLKTLQPKRFNWISDETNTLQDGFLAHEVTAVPEAITGTKDAVVTQAMLDSKEAEEHSVGDPIYQQIDHSKLVPLLVAAVQELTARVETLEAA